MIARSRWTLGAALLLVSAAAGCNRNPMDPDRAMIQRWAEELERDASQIREQIETMRQLAPQQWYTRMNEHADLVTGMLDRMERRMEEMGQRGGMGMGGMGMAIGDVGRLMGMSAEGHQAMLGLMQSLREDMQQLRGAPAAEVMERMPGQLARLEEMAGMMEESVAHMRSMGGMAGMR